MEGNKDEAMRAMAIAKTKLKEDDYTAAWKFALKAQRLYPNLENLPKLLAVCEVHYAAQTVIFESKKDWYGILHVDKSADDTAITKKYRKLALLLHPDKNSISGAKAAFQLITEAHEILTDRFKRIVYDLLLQKHSTSTSRRQPNESSSAGKQSQECSKAPQSNFPNNSSRNDSGSVPDPRGDRPRFWTRCHPCDVWYQYFRESLMKTLICQKCGQEFVAYDWCNGGVPPGFPQSGASLQRDVPNAETLQRNGERTTRKSSLDKFSAGSPSVGSKPKEKIDIDVDEGSGGNGERKVEKPIDIKSLTKAGKKRSRKSNDNSAMNESYATRLSRSRQRVSYKEHSSDIGDVRYSLTKSKGKRSEDCNSACPAAEQKKSVSVEKTKKNRCEMNKANKHEAAMPEQNDNSDPALKSNELHYPDPDFNDFDNFRTEGSFSVNQVWAVYDPLDDMPRSYALVKSKASSGFQLKISWLCPNPDTPVMQNWYESELPIACGKYSVKDNIETEDRLIFSHQVQFRKGRGRNIYFIYPRKGETWALFANCNLKWKTDPKKHENRPYQYEFVEIVSDFDSRTGNIVAYLSKVEGFTGIFQHAGRQKAIQASELYRFSHRIPSFRMKGNELEGVPPGSFEFDPASFLFQAPVDAKMEKGKVSKENENIPVKKSRQSAALKLTRSPMFEM